MILHYICHFIFCKYISQVCIWFYGSYLHKNKITLSFLVCPVLRMDITMFLCLKNDSSSCSFFYFEPSKVVKWGEKKQNKEGQFVLFLSSNSLLIYSKHPWSQPPPGELHLFRCGLPTPTFPSLLLPCSWTKCHSFSSRPVTQPPLCGVEEENPLPPGSELAMR